MDVSLKFTSLLLKGSGKGYKKCTSFFFRAICMVWFHSMNMHSINLHSLKFLGIRRTVHSSNWHSSNRHSMNRKWSFNESDFRRINPLRHKLGLLMRPGTENWELGYQWKWNVHTMDSSQKHKTVTSSQKTCSDSIDGLQVFKPQFSAVLGSNI